MKQTLFRKLAAVALVALVAVGASPLARAAGDIYDRLFQSELVQATTSADDKAVVLYIKYVGTSASGTMQLDDTAATIILKSGAQGAEAADTTVECPLSAPSARRPGRGTPPARRRVTRPARWPGGTSPRRRRDVPAPRHAGLRRARTSRVPRAPIPRPPAPAGAG